MERVILHIDVNNAFLSWSAIYLLNNGYKYDIRNSYAVIGGDEETRRGIVLAKSTPAKKLGIVTGETLYSARKKCRVLKTYPMQYDFYKEMSNKLFELLKNYTSDIEVASIDECYLDYTSVQKLLRGFSWNAEMLPVSVFRCSKWTRSASLYIPTKAGRIQRHSAFQ